MVSDDLKKYPGVEKQPSKDPMLKDDRMGPTYPWQIFYEQGSEF